MKAKRTSKAGRKPKPPDQKISRRKEVGFTEKQWILVEEKAVASGVEVGAWIREAAMEKAVR